MADNKKFITYSFTGVWALKSAKTKANKIIRLKKKLNKRIS